MRVLFRAGLIGAAVMAGALLVPRPAMSQTVVLGSSASAHCRGADCSIVRFALKLASEHHFDVIRIVSRDGSRWLFEGLVRGEDADGNDLGWAWTGNGSRLELRPNTLLGAEPVFLTVKMHTWSTTSEIFGPLIVNGRGEVRTAQGRSIAEFGGPVTAAATTTTPEPASLMLVGLGLAGVFGVRRRRSSSLR